MTVVVLGLLGAAALLVLLNAQAAKGNHAAAQFAFLAACFLLLLGGSAAWVALWLAGAKCDESCGSLSPSEGEYWYHTTDAWQWYAQLAVALLGFVALFAVVRNQLKRRFARVTLWTLVAAGAFLAWAAFMYSAGANFDV